MSKPLTTKQHAFVEHFLQLWNISEAAKRAGYANPYHNGHRLMEYDGIKEAIAARMTELKLSADEVLVRLGMQARGSIADVLRLPSTDPTPEGQIPLAIDDWAIDLIKAQKTGAIRMVKKIKSGEHGPELEMYSAYDALVQIGKTHGLFVEKIDMSRQEIEAFLDRLRDTLSPEEYARIVALAAGTATP